MPGLLGFVGGAITRNVALIVVAIIPLILKIGSVGDGVDAVAK